MKNWKPYALKKDFFSQKIGDCVEFCFVFVVSNSNKFSNQSRPVALSCFSVIYQRGNYVVPYSSLFHKNITCIFETLNGNLRWRRNNPNYNRFHYFRCKKNWEGHRCEKPRVDFTSNDNDDNVIIAVAIVVSFVVLVALTAIFCICWRYVFEKHLTIFFFAHNRIGLWYIKIQNIIQPQRR